MQKIFNLFIVLIILYLIFDKVNKSEKMSNTDIKKIIQKEYMIDVDAIRNLSKLANDLTVNRKLVVPGGLEIKGPLKVDNKITSKTLEVTHNADFGTSSNRKISIVPSSYKNDATYFAFYNGKKRTFYMIPRITGKLYNNGSLNCEGDITGTNIIVRKDVNANGKIKGGTLEIRGDSDFGTASGRKLQITSSNYGNQQTYIGFYNGNSRTNYLLPNKNNNELRVQYKLRTGSHFSCGGNVSGSTIYGNVPGYLKKGSNFKFSAVSGGYGGVVWSNSIRGNGNERGLAARRRSGGDQFRITYISR